MKSNNESYKGIPIYLLNDKLYDEYMKQKMQPKPTSTIDNTKAVQPLPVTAKKKSTVIPKQQEQTARIDNTAVKPPISNNPLNYGNYATDVEGNIKFYPAHSDELKEIQAPTPLSRFQNWLKDSNTDRLLADIESAGIIAEGAGVVSSVLKKAARKRTFNLALPTTEEAIAARKKIWEEEAPERLRQEANAKYVLDIDALTADKTKGSKKLQDFSGYYRDVVLPRLQSEEGKKRIEELHKYNPYKKKNLVEELSTREAAQANDAYFTPFPDGFMTKFDPTVFFGKDKRTQGILEHEVTHALQQGVESEIDKNLGDLILYEVPKHNSQHKQNLEYFNKEYEFGEHFERSPFLAQTRQVLIDNGIIKHHYDIVTPKMFEDNIDIIYRAPRERLFNIIDITTPEKRAHNFKILADNMNKLPALVPITAGVAAQQNKEMNKKRIPKYYGGGDPEKSIILPEITIIGERALKENGPLIRAGLQTHALKSIQQQLFLDDLAKYYQLEKEKKEKEQQSNLISTQDKFFTRYIKKAADGLDTADVAAGLGTGVSFLGGIAQNNALGNIGSGISAGVSVGSAFGPMGGAVGAGVGALTGGIKSIIDAIKAKKMKRIQDTRNLNSLILQNTQGQDSGNFMFSDGGKVLNSEDYLMLDKGSRVKVKPELRNKKSNYIDDVYGNDHTPAEDIYYGTSDAYTKNNPLLTPVYSQGGFANMPIQAEKYQGQKEMIQDSDGDIRHTNANQSHESMDNEATDVLEKGSRVFSARNKYTKSQWAAINDVVNGQLNMDLLNLGKGKKKGKISPADIAENIMKKYQGKTTAHSFNTNLLNDRNKEILLEQAFAFNEVVNNEKTDTSKFRGGGNLLKLSDPPKPEYESEEDFKNRWDLLDFEGNPKKPTPSIHSTPSILRDLSTFSTSSILSTPSTIINNDATNNDAANNNATKAKKASKALLYGTLATTGTQLAGTLSQKMYDLPSTDWTALHSMQTKIPVEANKNAVMRGQKTATDAVFNNSRNYQSSYAAVSNLTGNTQESLNNIYAQRQQQEIGLKNQKAQMWQQLLSQQEAGIGRYNQDKTALSNYKKSITGEFIKDNMQTLRDYYLDKNKMEYAQKTSDAIYEGMLKTYGGNDTVIKLLEEIKNKFNSDVKSR